MRYPSTYLEYRSQRNEKLSDWYLHIFLNFGYFKIDLTGSHKKYLQLYT